jgi:SAM-dependent methyltransferase
VADVDRDRLRRTFSEDAELYDRCRPGYPLALFEDLATLAGAGPGSRVLEIGCGTGQATAPLARLGYTIVAVELGAEMAAVARRSLAAHPHVRIVVGAFEDWPLPATKFDIVLSATAFHWLDPDTRMTKTADALRPDGVLAVVSTHHIAGGTEPFFVDVQQCYERFDPDTPPGLRLLAAVDIPQDSAEFRQSGRFGPVKFRRYEWDRTYTARGYLDLLSTYSGHRAMPRDAREGLFACIANLINNDHGGHVTKRYMTELALAHRLP